MPDKYKGIKFTVSLIERKRLDYKEIDELIKWCRQFHELGLAPAYEGGSSGNLSFRIGKNFVITAAKTALGSITRNDFVEVVFCDMEKKQIAAIGLKEPSSETMLHSAIYKARPDVNAVFHGHDENVMKCLEELDIVATEEEKPYGTVELVEEVLKVLGNNYYVVMKNHGFIALGKTMEQAGENAIEMYKKSVKA